MIEWTDWSDAVPVQLGDRDHYAEMAVEDVSNGAPHMGISTGDTAIIALRMSDGSIRVYDCIIRREGETR